MTVYSKRLSAPTLPATTVPAEMPMPTPICLSSSSATRRRRARSVPGELVDHPGVFVDDLDHDPKEDVE
jgi:hypothetical protein